MEAGSFDDPRTEILAAIILDHTRGPLRRLLVVGCGSGVETAVLARTLHAEGMGIDMRSAFDPKAAEIVTLQWGDATRLEFEDGSFDLAFSYHVLEHIPDYTRAIAEMRRVLSPGGTCCVGTPNRDRLVGYLGSKDASWTEKVVWNLWDWKAMLFGRFRNELGAHAGFTSGELKAALEQRFGRVEEVTQQYYERLYRKQVALIDRLGRSGLGRYLFPAVYFVAAR